MLPVALAAALIVAPPLQEFHAPGLRDDRAETSEELLQSACLVGKAASCRPLLDRFGPFWVQINDVDYIPEREAEILLMGFELPYVARSLAERYLNSVYGAPVQESAPRGERDGHVWQFRNGELHMQFHGDRILVSYVSHDSEPILVIN